eukprot:12904023-Prorocentrum_lima.AAC.1
MLNTPQIAPIPDHGTKINRLPTDVQNHLLQGPMKYRLAGWWMNGTTKERLISSGANFTYGYLQPTAQFKRMSE